MIRITNADRIVFPEIGRTKGDVVAYYERMAERMLPHLAGRPLSMRRYPRGLAAPGFFQKTVPDHYPDSIGRFAVPRSRAASKKHERPGAPAKDVTVYPLLRQPEHLPYVANQGAIELHVPTWRVQAPLSPDRSVVDLDPPPGALALVRRAARIVKDALEQHGLRLVAVATGSKGYHVVAAIEAELDHETLATTLQRLAALLAVEHPDELTTTFRVKERGERVFVDWLRNNPIATVVAPYSLRARPSAPVAAPLAWDELDETAPDRYRIDDVDALLDRPDTLIELHAEPDRAGRFVSEIEARFEASGLELRTFDRFRS